MHVAQSLAARKILEYHHDSWVNSTPYKMVGLGIGLEWECGSMGLRVFLFVMIDGLSGNILILFKTHNSTLASKSKPSNHIF